MTPGTTACQAPLSSTISWSLLKLMSIESVMPSNNLIHHHPLLLPSIFPSIRVFSSVSALHMAKVLELQPKCWSFSLSISLSSEYSGLISFRIAWFDPPCSPKDSQEPSQHHNSKASILQHSAFFTVQLSHPYMTTGKSIPLNIWTFDGK